MKIVSVTLENFGSFLGTHTIDLADRGMMFVAGVNEDEPRMRSNGAGKSTVFDSLEWCLFGEPPKNDAADSVVNERAASGTSVRLLDQEQAVTVQRFRKVKAKNGLRLWVGSHVSDLSDAETDHHRTFERTSLDVRQTQADVEAMLGLDSEVFRASVYRSQTETFNFADATDTERKEILTRILQLDELDQWLERAKQARGQKDIERAQVHALRVTDEGELRGIENSNHEHGILEWDRQKEARLEALRARYCEKKVRREELMARIRQAALLEARLQELRAQRPIESQGSRLELEECVRELAVLREQARSIEAEIQKACREAKAMELEGAGGCSRCRQIVTAEHLFSELSRIKNQTEALRSELGPITARIRKMEIDLRSFEGFVKRDRESFEHLLKEHLRETATLESDLRRTETERGEADQIEIDLSRLEVEAQTIKIETNPFVAAKQKALERIAELRAQVASHATLLSELEHRQRLLEFWVHGFGPRGLKSYVLDSELGELNEAANRFVKLLTGGTVWVRLETQTMAKSTKTLSERFNIRVFRWNTDGTTTERNYRSWSGGEKARIALGIDFGLSSLVARRASKSYDLLILDEVFRHLDGKGREAVLELLQHLSTEKSSIFVIDHDTEFRGEFERILTIRKRDGKSEVLTA